MRLGRMSIEQEDGAVWQSYYDYDRNPDQHFLILTSAGREEFLHSPLGYPTLKKLFRTYRKAETGPSHPSVRDFLGEGQQARVFGLTNRYAVREVLGNAPFYGALSDLTRIARLSAVVEGGLPRWIDVPPIYAMYSDAAAIKQYTLMKRIDSGMTVEDIADFDNVPDHAKMRTLREFGREPSQEDREKIILQFDKAKHILDSVISARGMNPDELLTDWAMRNVVVDRVMTPVAGERNILNIIDQN